MDEEKCAHLVLQLRTQVLDERLEETFRHWYPDSGQDGLSTHFFMLSTLAQSTLGGSSVSSCSLSLKRPI